MKRGDIYHVNLNPIAGREQAGARYVMVLTRSEFNRFGTPLVCPVTLGGDFARHRGFAVSLAATGLKTQGVILCHQVRALDLTARKACFVESVPEEIVDDVLARVAALFE